MVATQPTMTLLIYQIQEGIMTNVEVSNPIEVGTKMSAAGEDSAPIRTSTRKRVLLIMFE